MQSQNFDNDEADYLNTNLPEVCGHTFFSPPLNDTSVVIDLGGSTAGFSRTLASTYGCFCHVVEATSVNVDRIQETEQIRKYHYAVAGDNMPVKLHLADENYHWGSINPDPKFKSKGMEEVQGITLESFLNEIGCLEPDLVKVDIEGAEFEMFDSSPDDIIKGVGQFTVEFHDFIDISLGCKVSRILARLKSLGFICIVFTQNFHGDVLFINPNRISLNPIMEFNIRYIQRNMRGLSRIISRFISG
jgi:FkbM family methyltransferase